MPDAMARSARAPQDWGAAFAALPLAEPPGDGWARLAARLDARPHRRWPAWLALAAALLLAVALPWKLQQPAPPAVQPLASAHDPALEALYAESAQLETLLAYARDDRVSSGSAAALVAQIDGRLASIDAALAQPQLTPAQQRALWRERVDTLRTLTGFETTRRWLSAQGERYDGALVRVD